MTTVDSDSTQDTSVVPPPVLVQNGPIPNVYAEGVTQFQFGYPVSRLKLHSNSTRVTDDPNSQQVREICLDLTMPTGGLIEMCQRLLQIIGNNQELLLKTKDEQDKLVMKALASLSSLKSEDGN